MNEYIEYIYILLLALANCLVPVKKQKYTSTLLMIVMMLMCGFRAYDVGTDTHNYVTYASARFVDDYKWGPLYLPIKALAEMFSEEGSAFLMIMAILTYIPLIYIIQKKSLRPALSVLMYIIPCGIFFNETFNIARQSIAIVYILLAVVMLEDEKRKLSYCLVALAFFFHPYTIFFALFYFVYKVSFTMKMVLWIMGVSMLIGVVGALSGIMSLLNTMAMMFSEADSDLLQKFAKYGNGYDIASNFSVVGTLSHMLPMVGICVLGANKYSANNIYFKMMVCGSAITNLFVSVIFCERIASTFTLSQILAVPFIYTTMNKKYRFWLILLLLLTTFLYVYNMQGYSHQETWTKYHTIFD